MSAPRSRDTREADYTRRLERLEGAAWKRWLDVQAPYRWNLRRLDPGFVLDVGCGIGRNLVHLDRHGVGVDHNPESIETARERGCTAFTPDEFAASEFARPGRFDALLCAHVLEHMTSEQASVLLGDHLRFVRPGGRVVLITPQEAGYRSDATHVEFVDDAALRDLLRRHDVAPERSFSFPFPRVVGRVFAHNEFVVVGRKA